MTAASTMPANVVTLPAGSQVASSSNASSTLNQNDFLTLLTTQLEKQDPLNPTSPSDLASELAQFSTATGVQNVNTTLNANAGLQAAALIGHSVAVSGNALVLGQSGGATGGFNLAAAAQDAAVTVTDPAGKIVASLDLGAQAAGAGKFSWDGKALDGSPAPAGTYSFTIGAVDSSGKAVAATSYAVVPVTAVALGGTGGPVLDLGGGLAPVALSAVQQVY